MKHKVIDNFLEEEYFNSLVALFMKEEKTGNNIMPWYFQSSVAYSKKHKEWKPKEEDDNIFYMAHMFYEQNAPVSPLYNNIIPLLGKLEVKCLIRVKANLYPNTKILHEHPMHIDMEFSHSTAILSLNTCDGYTKLKDGTKINSVANRILLFDASEEHCSTTTTNDFARFNININYIQEQLKGTN